ncbi:MAG: regulatory protein RecX [Clostridia bacterium]|nr:regulatory protein RecX [Clostridia bacterium]
MNDVKSEALRLALGKRRTKKQIVEKLIAKGFEPDAAEEAAEYYKDAGYIDHRDFARRFAHDAANIKGYGPDRIRRDLRERGVEDEYIEEALNDIEFDIKPIMQKKFKECEDTKTMNKIINCFLRRGFSFDEIKNAIREVYLGDNND